MKKIFRLLILGIFVALLFLNMTVFAKAFLYGSEAKGYIVSTVRQGKNIDTYDDSKLNTTYRAYSSAAASRWKNTKTMTFKRNVKSKNKIITSSKKDTTAVATCYIDPDPITGKIKSFKIVFNKIYMDYYSTSYNKEIATHEFGHAIGLLDLYNKSNKNKIMYGIGKTSVINPTKYDIKGAILATKK